MSHTRCLALVALLALAGCVSPDEPLPEVRSASAVAWLDPAALRRVVEESVAWWGGSPGLLDAWTFEVYDGAPPDCAGSCTIPERAVIELSTQFAPCTEGMAIPHEVGHAVLYVLTGDADGRHADPRWAHVRPAGPQFCP